MCTVSFVRDEFGILLTSNRDESTSRPASLQPAEYVLNNTKLLFPKDAKAGGTWFVVTEHGHALVLLNGAFERHTPVGNYRMSRGLILLEIAADPNPIIKFESLNLENIEPFTIVSFTGTLHELRWDGSTKYTSELNSYHSHIWSSSTLYEKNVRDMREQKFNSFLSNNPHPDADDLLAFHHLSDGDQQNSFVMNRHNKLRTLSITQARLKASEIEMVHYDLMSSRKTSFSMSLTHPFAV